MSCGDHGCLLQYKKPGGQGTNGGCKCLHDIKEHELRMEIQSFIRELKYNLIARDKKIEAYESVLGQIVGGKAGGAVMVLPKQIAKQVLESFKVKEKSNE